MNNIGGKEIDTPDSLRGERDALREVLREIVDDVREREGEQKRLYSVVFDRQIFERAEKLLEGAA